MPGILLASSVRIQAAGGGGPNAFSDAFVGNGALGANWSTVAGSADKNGGTYRIGTGSFGVVTSVFVGMSTGSLTQYAMATLGPNNQYPWLVFRYTDASSPYYAFQIDGAAGTVEWYMFENAADTTGTQIGVAVDTGGDMTGVACAITVTGAGANTDVRIWRSPGGLPSAADNWNGDTTPDATWLTTDPGASAVDSGMLVGLGGQASIANNVTWASFFGGGLL